MRQRIRFPLWSPQWAAVALSAVSLAHWLFAPAPPPDAPQQAFWPVLIGAVASIAGGLLSKKGADKSAKEQQRAAASREAALRRMFGDVKLQKASQLLFGNMFAPGAGISPGLNMPNPHLRGGSGMGNPGANYGDPMFNPVIGGRSLGAGSIGNTASMPNGPAAPVAPPLGSGPTATPEHRMAGGPVMPGRPYMVGEQGPEVITPQQPGMVIPNPATMAGMPTPAWSAQATARPGTQAQAPGPMIGPPQAPMQGGHIKQPMAYRATGGPLQPGQPTVVGEQGPEVVQPGVGPAGPPAAGTAPPPVAPLPSPTAPTTGGGQPIPPPAPTHGGKGKGKPPRGNVTPPAPTGFTPPTTGDPTLGQLTSYWTNQFLTNPGQLSPIAYQRQQEQANMALNNQTQQLQSGLAAGGIDINSPAGQAMMQATLLNHQGQRQEAARDYSLAQENLFRQDIGQGINNYMAMLNQVFARQAQKGGLVAGAPMPYNANAGAGQNMWGNILGSLGSVIAGTDWSRGSQTTAGSGGANNPRGAA